MKKKLLLLIMLFCTFFVHQKANSQVTLSAGDIAFIGYNTSPLDGFSFITLKAIPAGTIIYFTEQGWNGNAVNPTWVLGSTEPHLIWTVPSLTPAGTIVSLMETVTGDTFTLDGTTNLGLAPGYTTFNLSGGDQILAYQSSTGVKPVSPALPTFIAGVNGDYNSADYDATTTWNLPGTTGGNSSALPLGLTNGVNCISLFPAPGPEVANSKLKSSVTLVGTSAQVLATINNPANWDHQDNVAGNYTITPISYPTPVVTAASPPTVTTDVATNVGSVKATMGGKITATGGDATIVNGIVWGTATAPTISNNVFPLGTGTADFSGTVGLFPPSTLIYYRAYATNSGGTGYGAEFTFTTGAALSTSSTSQTNVSCNGGANGTATVVATGGKTPYTYSWSPSGGTGATGVNLVQGSYTVTITDGEATQITRNFTITQPALLNLLTGNQTNVSCFSGANGTATVAPAGGTPGYTYSWSPSGGTNATASGLSIGTYTVTVTDANSCQATRSFTITQPGTALDVTSGSQTNVSCFSGTNGTATVNPSGGTFPYTYSWSPSGGTAASATGLAQGTYTVTVTDANACQATKTFTISQPASALVASVGSQTNISCNGGVNGSATVSVSGGTPGYTYSWSPSGGTAATANGLSAGTYTVTVTDANACQATQSFTITQPPVLVASPVSQTNIACNGTATGEATISATGGTGSYTYSWSPSGGTAASATGLTAGTYTVTVTDANSCTATQSFTITQPPVLFASAASQTNVSCFNGANGTATVSVTGGTPGYTYSWSPSGGTTASATGLTAGTYTVTVTDANSCTATQSFTITEPAAALTASIGSQTNVSCNSGTNGTATVSVAGGTPGYTYSWSPSGGTAASASGLSAGTYTVTVTDANACQTTQSFTITEPSVLVATPISQTNIACNGATTGSATVNATGGAGSYTYSWSPSGGTAASATGLAAGTYTVTVTDANSCFTTQSFTITEPASALVASDGGQTNVSCNNGANGTATVSVTGGTPGYTYSWAPSGGTLASANGLTAGTYTVTVTDANGCTATQAFTITEPAALVASNGGQTNVSCNGGTNATATVSVTGGTTGYTYSWSPSGGTSASASGLSAGTYTVTVTDANACQTTQSFTITEPATLVASNGGQTNVSCNSGTNGTATVSVTGGTAGYTYLWSPAGGTADTATGLTAGTYTVTVTDANGCSATQSFTITEPSALIATPISQTNVACNGTATGSATVSATGGTGAYTYSWAPSGGTADTATGLTAGTYTVTVTDANGCTATQSFTITEPTALIASATGQTNVSCNGGANGTATVSATGGTPGYTYSWAPSGGTAASANGLSAGTYTVTVTDANGCSATQSFTISEPAALVATGSQTDVSCNGGSNATATVTVTGGTGAYTYSWAPFGGNSATATGLSIGTYTVIVTDANSCQTTQSFTITEPAPLVASMGLQTNVSCNGGANGTATVNVTGGTAGYTYSWSPSGGTADTATGLTAGTYTVAVTDANGCFTTQSFTITEPSVLIASPLAQTNVACNGAATGSAAITATGGTGGYTYSWSPSGGTADTASGLTAGTYTVTVTDANGCFATQSFTITEPTAIITSVSSQTNVSCNGGANATATIVATGGTPGYTYSWAPSGGTADTATGLSAGTYTVTVTDANGCSATQSVVITEPAIIITSVSSQTNVSCNSGSNGSATVSATGGTPGYTYSWAPFGGTADTATGLSAGTYTVTITDANGCSATQSLTITEPNVLVASNGGQTNVSCNGGTNATATVVVTGGTTGYTYSWAPFGGTADTATGLAAGTYTVTVTDANGCTATQSFTITEPTAIVASATSITDVSCNGGANGSATVSATGGTGGYTYSWSPSGGNSDTASGLTAGTYTATVTDANGCSATQTFVINQPAALVTSALSQTDITCNGGANGSATVTASGGTGAYTYSWSPSGGTTDTATGLTAGTYTATVTDANGCSATQTFVISQPNALSVSVNVLTNVSCNSGSDAAATAVVTGGTGVYTYSWSPSGGTADTANGLSAGTYTVTVTDANGCTASETFTINEPTAITATITQTNVTCNGGNDGSATINVTGGSGSYTYVWSPAGGTADTATGLSAGTYSVTVTDANGCSLTQTVTIITTPDNNAPIPTVANLPVINGYCSVLSAEIAIPTATDNCVGTINGTTSSPLNYTTEGTYVITWSYNDGNGNTTTQNQTVNVLASPLSAVTFSDADFTFDGSVHTIQVANLPVGANVSYTTTPASGSLNGATNAGSYTITAIVNPSTAAPNCSPVTLTANLTIDKAAQQITFDAIPVKVLGTNNTFDLDATSSSGLPVRYSFTYTSALPPATVSAAGQVNMLRTGQGIVTAHQDGDNNYLPAATVSQILTIMNNNADITKLTIGGVVYNNPPKQIIHLMLCGENSINITSLNDTNATISPSANFTLPLPRPGIYNQTITVTSQDGSVVNKYNITIIKPFSFYDIVRQKFNNVLLVNNNPQTNGGYDFVAYEWFKNGQSIGTGQYYSAGNSTNNLLDPAADYMVKLTTRDGKVLQTCSDKVTLQNTLEAKLYPNPTEAGKVVTVEADFPEDQLKDMQISLYSVSGQLIKTLKSSTVKTEVQLPDSTDGNMYVVVIETADFKKSLKVIVK
ncbi:T9SS type A sorting domain-containing protein [Flavobacterium sp. HTF]|uniref:T9SS type A sorting domain-containing protein n=1 Tax=Flavobacterium sp. HTF TaxID=2170732 RepID=UPI0014020368|nr:T9SS type A sorting domain-containing protein [Flavobacterium sp. HTF]